MQPQKCWTQSLTALSTSGSKCLQTTSSQLTVIRALIMENSLRWGCTIEWVKDVWPSSSHRCSLESWMCTDYMPLPVTRSTSRNRPNPYRPVYTCIQTAYTMLARLTQMTKGGCYSTLSTPPKSAPGGILLACASLAWHVA